MMRVRSLEVQNTVYNITGKSNILKILLRDEQLKSLNIDTHLVINVEYLYEPFGEVDRAKTSGSIEKTLLTYSW